MNIWQKQVVIGLLSFIIFATVLLSFTFITFPLRDWADLWSMEVLDLPYVLLTLALSITGGLAIGMAQGFVFRRKFHYVEHQLDEIAKGNPVLYDDTGAGEIQQIEKKMKQIEARFKKQTETAQRLASERAEEREKSLQEVVVQERNRLARELHDSVSQQLFAASMMMSAINEGEKAEQKPSNKQLAMVEKMIHQSQLEMRALLLHLRPVALKDKSLQEGCEELLHELTQKVPMKIEWTVESLKLEKGIEDQLFRILQEAVSNTLRHAKAEALTVMLIERDDHVILRMVDDGIGFDVEEAKTSSYGLQNMQERAFEVGGTLKIVSLKNQGTRLEVKVPHFKKGGGLM
ncbi:sensor histidine kinase [Halobacillus shinanisalinarum]|uniref:Sensor histidine kinase n=1 Tax=Halobacillus shinanisalinarum TaxID=2932258 RepID=A0ABY4H4I7_9BACI|nr:sensor histidine kinase [Halobacillus shinanisalinarum]UOQ95221.1 sensor histidine kinase [Halobacillus shinanisalinarum]